MKIKGFEGALFIESESGDIRHQFRFWIVVLKGTTWGRGYMSFVGPFCEYLKNSLFIFEGLPDFQKYFFLRIFKSIIVNY